MTPWFAALLAVPPGVAEVPNCSVATAERASVGEIKRREPASGPDEGEPIFMIMMSGYRHYLPGAVIHAVSFERLPDRSR